jgi:hypothetical protein
MITICLRTDEFAVCRGLAIREAFLVGYFAVKMVANKAVRREGSKAVSIGEALDSLQNY